MASTRQKQPRNELVRALAALGRVPVFEQMRPKMMDAQSLIQDVYRFGAELEPYGTALCRQGYEVVVLGENREYPVKLTREDLASYVTFIEDKLYWRDPKANKGSKSDRSCAVKMLSVGFGGEKVFCESEAMGVFEVRLEDLFDSVEAANQATSALSVPPAPALVSSFRPVHLDYRA